MDLTTQTDDIQPIRLVDEMKKSYLDYAMSVIVSRALPDVRDGLKPVHRRILYAMKEGGYDWAKPYRKSARIVGDVMGKFHPHGDSAIYDSMVRMAQDFSLRLPLIDGQGNFGSMDGDSPAAMRYTEARLAKSAEALLADIDKETVNFQPNYDESEVEPVVLPSQYPNLLVNGAGGIAVGMATNIPPHNLGEVIDATLAYMGNPDITDEELFEIVPGPDFPTGGLILGRNGCFAALKTGRGSIMMRGRTHFEEKGKRESIVITEIPYQVNKVRLVEKIAENVKAGNIEGISEIRDESDRDGVRVVVDLKKDATPEVVLNQIYRFTPLQTSFGANILALSKGRPDVFSLKGILEAFVEFREEVITRRTIFDLKKARNRAHILIGLAIAVANIDEMIAIIRNSKDPNIAKEQLMAKTWPAADVAPLIKLVDPSADIDSASYQLSEAQAKAILDLKLQRLTGLERDKISDELNGIIEQIKEFLHILGSKERLYEVMEEELKNVKERFANPRRTSIEDVEFEQDIEALIQKEEMVVTVTNTGYFKRVPLSLYRAQRRGGKGRSGMSTRDKDYVTKVFVASTHSPLLIFTTDGIVYHLKVYQLPLGTPQSRGKPIVNLIPNAKDVGIATVLPLPEDEEEWKTMSFAFATSGGKIRRNDVSDFSNIRANGKIAMKLDDKEKLVAVRLCDDEDDIVISTLLGKCIRFPLADLRVFASRSSTGVRGIKLGKGDHVIAMSILKHIKATPEERDAYIRYANAKRRSSDEEGEDSSTARSAALETMSEERLQELEEKEQFLMITTSRGFGKRSSSYEYRISGRGGQGVKGIELTSKTGDVVSVFRVEDSDHVIMVSDGGQIIRSRVEEIRIAGRATQGVTLFRVAGDERVVSAARLDEPEESEIEDGEEIAESSVEALEAEIVAAEQAEEATEASAEPSDDPKDSD